MSFTVCTNFTYDPNEFQVQLDVMNNEQVVYQNMFSAKNPPPMCMPVPYTPAQMCIKLFNIFTPGRNLHMCMDIETKIQEKPYLVRIFQSCKNFPRTLKIEFLFKISVLILNKLKYFGEKKSRLIFMFLFTKILHFDCMRMGQDGIKYPLKPEENGGEVGGGGGGGGGGLFGTGLFQNGIFGNRPTQAPASGPTDVPQIDTDVFDPITEIKLKPWISKNETRLHLMQLLCY